MSANMLLVLILIMQKIKINVQEPYYSFILNGQKTVEGRLDKGKFARINVGDVLIIEKEENKFTVIEKNSYKTFREMINNEGLKNIIPDKETVDDAVNVYYKFYTKELNWEVQHMMWNIFIRPYYLYIAPTLNT